MELIYGNEPYLINYELSKIKKNHDETEIYYAWTDEARESLFCPPIFGEKKAVILMLPELLEGMEQLLDAPCNVFLVIGKLDKRKKAYQTFSSCRQVPCNKIDMAMLKNFVLRECSRCSMDIQQNAFTLFLSRIQYQENECTNLYKVRTYIHQMCSSAKADQIQHIGTEHVNAFVPETAQEQAYHLVNFLFQKEPRAYMQLTVTLAEEKDGICMLSSLLRTFRTAYKAALYKDTPKKELENLLNVPAYQYAAVQELSFNSIQTCMDILMAGICEIKSGNNPKLCCIKALCKLWDVVRESDISC